MEETFNYEQFLPAGYKVHPFVILELSDKHKAALYALNSDKELPTIDPDALMSTVLGMLVLSSQQENPVEYELEIHQILEEILGDPGSMPESVKEKIVTATCIVVDETMLLLEKHGVFVNGAQPYEFACFTATNDAVLRKSTTYRY